MHSVREKKVVFFFLLLLDILKQKNALSVLTYLIIATKNTMQIFANNLTSSTFSRVDTIAISENTYQ